MEYKIGKIIEDHIKKQDISFRKYAIDHDMNDNDLTLIRLGYRAASAKKLSLAIDIELLREPISNEIKDILDTLDTETIIDVYNLIYAREREK